MGLNLALIYIPTDVVSLWDKRTQKTDVLVGIKYKYEICVLIPFELKFKSSELRLKSFRHKLKSSEHTRKSFGYMLKSFGHKLKWKYF